MANKKLCFGMLGMVLVFGIVLFGCDPDGGNESNTDPKTIKITGFNLEGYDQIFVFLCATPQYDWPPVVESRAEISGSDITVELAPTLDDESAGEPWTGSGKYYLWIQLGPTENQGPGHRPVYVYAVDGASPVSNGATADYSANGTLIYIEDTVTILEFSEFVYRGVDPEAG
jgi:hypothetical protein